MEIGRWLLLEQGGGEAVFVDRSIRVFPAACSRGCYWTIMDIGRRRDGPTNQPPCSGISGSHWKAHEPTCNMHECWLPQHSIVPKEPMDEIRAIVTQCLDKTAM